MRLRTAEFSHVGARACNQDALASHIEERYACFIVSDGVGSSASGGTAARIVVDSITQAFAKTPDISSEALQHYLHRAHTEILERASHEAPTMSATVVGLFIDRREGRAIWGHAGDSRLYFYRRCCLHHITRDHSLAEHFAIHDDQAEAPNILYRVLGGQADEARASISDPLPIEDGDAYLLCTDGFWQHAPASVLEHSLRLAGSPNEWLAIQRLRLESLNPRPTDNYSALAVWVGEPQQVTLLAMSERRKA